MPKVLDMEDLTIDNAHDGFRTGTFTAHDLVSYYLKRINDVDQSGPNLNGILAVSDTALAEAEAQDAHFKETGDLNGPLHGIPVIVKDQAATAGLTTTYGSIKAKDNMPTEDATLVKKLKDAGAIVLAKSTMPGTWYLLLHMCLPSHKRVNVALSRLGNVMVLHVLFVWHYKEPLRSLP